MKNLSQQTKFIKGVGYFLYDIEGKLLCISQFQLRPSPPPGLTPGISVFFLLDGKFPGVGTLKLPNAPWWGLRKRANAPPPGSYVPNQHCSKFSFIAQKCHFQRFLCVIFELFCLQNSLIAGVQPQVSGKVGSLVGSFLGGQCSAFPTTVEFYRKASCRGRNKNADENARKILLLKRHYESVLISFA